MSTHTAQFVQQPASEVLKLISDLEARHGAELQKLEADFDTRLKKSDTDLEARLQREVIDRVRDAERVVTDRLNDALTKEKASSESLAKARDLEREANHKLQSSISVNLQGALGPAGYGKPLRELLGARFARAARYGEAPPTSAWYLVSGWAFGVADTEGVLLPKGLSPEAADNYVNTVFGIVAGVSDETHASLGGAYGCSMYATAGAAHHAANPKKAFVHLWPGGVSRDEATQYCRRTWIGASSQGTSLEDWLRDDKSLTMVEGRGRYWFFDMTGGVDVASWTERMREAFTQLQAAGLPVERGERKRTRDDDNRAYGQGIHLPHAVVRPDSPVPEGDEGEIPSPSASPSE